MPVPTTPTWISPAEGATVDSSVLLQWTAGTVSGGGGGTTPTAAITAPVEGAQLESGSYTLVQVQVVANGNTITGVELLVDGTLSASANPMVFNSTTGRWEGVLSLSTGTALGARTMQARALWSGGPTLSAVRNFTAVQGDAVVTDYEIAVNAKRSALSLPDVDRALMARWSEFWARVGNRDSELSTSRRAGIKDVFLLRQDYNVGGGNDLVGLKGTVLTRAGTTLPTWGATGSTFAGGDARWASGSGGLLTGQSLASLLVVARVTGAAATEAIASQYMDETTPGGFTVQRSASIADGLSTRVIRSAGSGVTSTDSAGYLANASYVGGLGSFQSGASELPRVQELTPESAEFTVGGTSYIGTVSIPATPFIIGNRSSLANGLHGDVALVVASNFLHAADHAAILQIARETILSGVSLVAA